MGMGNYLDAIPSEGDLASRAGVAPGRHGRVALPVAISRDLVADSLSGQAYEDVITGVSAEAVRTLLATLTERERQVLAWRFGLDGEELSLRQIARRLGVSAERVRQIEQRGLIKLRTSVLPTRVDD
jgi:RNA polymerase sigma factor (sigma-70 family)